MKHAHVALLLVLLLGLTACRASAPDDAAADQASDGSAAGEQTDETVQDIPDIDVCIEEMAANGAYTSYDYDADGNRTRASLYASDNSIEQIEYDYDSDGRCIREMHSTVDTDGTVTQDYTVDIDYDKAGNVIRRACTNADGTAGSYTEYDYDIDGNVLRQTNYDADGAELEHIQSEYGNGLLLSTTFTSAADSSVYMTVYEYDGSGNAIRSITTDKAGEVSSSTEAQFDEQGHQIELTQYDQNGTITSHESRTYSGDNLIQTALRDANGQTYQTIDCTWISLKDYLKRR